MAIQINGYNENYSNFKHSSIPKVNEDTILQQQQQQKEAKRIPENLINSIEMPRIKNESLENISLSLKVEDFNFVGKDSELESLDMKKALSDLRKDQVLQEYNYFVGSARNTELVNSSKDGMVLQKF